MWAKNICLDDKAVNWEFKEDFINRFIIRYGQDFNYGVPYYRRLINNHLGYYA